MRSRAELSGGAYEETVTMLMDEYEADVQDIMRAFMQDGYPPGTTPLSPAEQFRQLLTMKQSGDPAFWNSAKAQQEFARLEKRFLSEQVG